MKYASEIEKYPRGSPASSHTILPRGLPQLLCTTCDREHHSTKTDKFLAWGSEFSAIFATKTGSDRAHVHLADMHETSRWRHESREPHNGQASRVAMFLLFKDVCFLKRVPS